MLIHLRRGRRFYTELIRLALPLVLQNLIMTSLSLIDTFMVGALGESSMAGVTVANTPIFVMDLLIFGLQSGSAVLISQYWGKGDRESINRIIGIGYYAAGGLTALFAFIMLLFPFQAMSLFCNDTALVEIAASYIRYLGVTYVFVGLTAIYTAASRSMENPKLGLIIFSTSMVLNTFLNWVLIFGNLGAPALGVEGAAIATLISFALGFVLMVAHAVLNKRFRLIPRFVFRPGMAMLRSYIKYATPVLLNETLWGVGTAIYPTIMGHMQNSQEILAAFTVAGNVANMCTVAVFAVAGTSATIIGREIGKGNRDEVYGIGSALSTIAFTSGLIMGAFLMVVLHTVIIPYLYPLFKLSEMGAGTATMMMTVFSALLALRSYTCTNIVGVLRGGGDVRAATLIDVLPLWCVAVPLAALFGLVLKLDVLWVYLAMALDSIIKFSFGLGRFRSKKWINDVTNVEV